LIFSLAESTESSNPKSEGKWVNNNENEVNNSDENQLANNGETENEIETEESEEEDEEKIPDAPLDFSITLTDSSGEKISFLLSEFSHLQRQIKSRVLKIDFLDDNDHSENIFQTFFFDLEKLSALNPNFRSASLKELRFDFDQNEKGVIILDQVGVMKLLK
jgi:hypothetical protein